MKLNIYHSKNLKLTGKGIIRNAVRGVIYKESKILLIYSSVNGDYKLPGGGIEIYETHEQALKREILEECGLKLKSVNEIIGLITEFDKAKESRISFFAMQSFYYLCEVKSYNFKKLNLDLYEKELKFTPVWVDINEAISVNTKLMDSGVKFPKWTERDTIFLKYLKQMYQFLCNTPSTKR